MPKSKQTDSTLPSIRILQVNSCKTMSGKSTLTYQIGCNDSSDIYLRVYSNDGGGFFNNSWVAFDLIQQVLKDAEPITSFLLFPLFEGRSTNSPGFLLAALKNEGLIEPYENNQRHHSFMNPEPFLAKVNNLSASKVNLKPSSKPIAKKKTSKKKVSKKTVTKKRTSISK